MGDRLEVGTVILLVLESGRRSSVSGIDPYDIHLEYQASSLAIDSSRGTLATL